MSKAEIFEEVEEFKRYRKYETIPITKKAELMEMIKIGINPESIQIDEKRLRDPKISQSEKDELIRQQTEAVEK